MDRHPFEAFDTRRWDYYDARTLCKVSQPLREVWNLHVVNSDSRELGEHAAAAASWKEGNLKIMAAGTLRESGYAFGDAA
ncbi:MAG: hypothetical protein HKL95_08840 [Phycisphaerae bacterium]|nr:hypothetical protein [Phycisphaerae bacterium]